MKKGREHSLPLSYYAMCCLLHKSKELKNTEDNTDKAVQFHEAADDGKDNANDGNLGENADQYAYYSTNHYKDQQLNDERGKVLFLDVKRCGPKFLHIIHNEYTSISYKIIIYKLGKNVNEMNFCQGLRHLLHFLDEKCMLIRKDN